MGLLDAPPHPAARRRIDIDRPGVMGVASVAPVGQDPVLNAYSTGLAGVLGGESLQDSFMRLAAIRNQSGGLSPEYAAAVFDSPLAPGFGAMATTQDVAGGLAKVLDDLPMDEASRMARSAEMGFGDADLYHFTRNDIDQFVPGRWRGATFLADTPAGAQKGAGAGGMEHPALGGPAGNAPLADPNIMPVRVRGPIFGRDDLPEGWVPERMTYGEWRKEIDEGWKTWEPPNSAEWSDAQKAEARFWRREALDQFTEAVPESEFAKYAEADLPLARVPAPSRPIGWESFEGFGSHPFSGGIPREELRGLLSRLGYTGAMIRDESGIATAMLDPAAIRSRFARFDPRNIKSRDLLAGIVPGGLGLSALANNEGSE